MVGLAEFTRYTSIAVNIRALIPKASSAETLPAPFAQSTLPDVSYFTVKRLKPLRPIVRIVS